MRHHDVAKAMGGGLLGTLLQTLIVYGVVPVLAAVYLPTADKYRRLTRRLS